MDRKNLTIVALTCLVIFETFLLFVPQINLTIQNSAKTEKIVVLFFDDGWENQYSIAYPILEMHGFHATFGIITNSIGELTSTEWSYMTAEQVRELWLNDMEMASHSHNHPLLANLTEDQLRMEISESKVILEEMLGASVGTFIVPYNEMSSDDEKVILEYYLDIRPLENVVWVENQTVEELSQSLKDVTFLVYHRIIDRNSVRWTTQPNLFRKHMKYLHDNGYKVVSFHEYLSGKE